MRKLRRLGCLLFIAALLVMLAPMLPFAEGTAEAYTTGDDYPAEYKNKPKDAVVDRWNFYNRECTSFAAWCLNSRNGVAFTNQYLGASRWGNANTWGTVAQSLGVTVNNTPAVGAIAWWNTGQYGHVAWVKSVSGSNVVIEEYNWNGDGNFHTRTIASTNPTGFIHIRDINPTFALDVNGLLDGTVTGNTSGYGTFDIYINGSLAGNDVSDYYNASAKPGTTWEIKDIKVANGKSFNGIAAGSRTGTLNGDMKIQLQFTTIPASLESSVATTTKVYNGHTYIYVERLSTWYAAKQFSESLGGHLVTVTSAGEDNFIKNLTGGKAVWIGLSDKASEGSWQWLTGESYSYKNWNSGEPNDSAGDEGEEDYVHYSDGGNWNDNGGYKTYHFVCEIDKAYTVKYNANGGTGAPAAQTKGYGVALRLSSKAPTKDCHTFVGWATSPDAQTANYKAGAIYSRNANVTLYAVWKEGKYTDWSTTKPTGVDSSLIETKTQYRYADLKSSAWKQSSTSTLDYVKSWPGGFNTGHSLYGQYHKTPATASETATTKTTVSESLAGYIYWHWCYGTYEYGPINRKISDEWTSTFPTFHAFFSTQNAGHVNPEGRDGGVPYYPNSGVCKDTYWYFQTPVYRQTIVNYTRDAAQDTWSSWSSWSDRRVTASDTRKVQTRTVYRYLKQDIHKWDAGKVTKKATTTSTGIKTFTCTLCGKTKKETIAKLPANKPSYVRIYGADRYATSLKIADAYKKALGVSKFSVVCVADGVNFPDALAGAYFASQNKAPIIDIRSNAPTGPQTMNALNYIKKNLKAGGTVYILGGPGSVPASVQTSLKKAGFKVQRLWGQNRYLSNIEILKAAKVKAGTEFIVTTGTTFADALTASATGKPVLLVAGNALTKEQKAYLAKAGVKKFTIVGTTKEVSIGIENQLKKYASVSRISGTNAYERSIAVAKRYFPGTRTHVNIADGRNFPDALCAGPLA
ncbi:MAG: cell wall-binding repeat-containing protein, partial [Firmicutes bacterium]|nr:cell wall-binding repeat-containing protein [Bacillota bacterium]